MTATEKKNSLSRDQAAAIYEDLRKSFAAYSTGVAPQPKPATKMHKMGSINSRASAQQSYQRPMRQEPTTSPEEQMLALMLAKQAAQKEGKFGSKIAVSLVLLAAGLKLALGAIEYTGVLGLENAQASVSSANFSSPFASNSNFTPEQTALLKALDARRVELEVRRQSLDKREEEFANRDREFAIKLAELRELTQTLKGNRDTESKKKTTQLDQLSNVYGSMDPKEAALLIEQLDDTIAIELLNRMPEKRIGQILSLMNKEKALIITKMLSGRVGV